VQNITTRSCVDSVMNIGISVLTGESCVPLQTAVPTSPKTTGRNKVISTINAAHVELYNEDPPWAFISQTASQCSLQTPTAQTNALCSDCMYTCAFQPSHTPSRSAIREMLREGVYGQSLKGCGDDTKKISIGYGRTPDRWPPTTTGRLCPSTADSRQSPSC
jgi:hypothetical protein